MGQSVISEKEFQVIKQIADNGLAEDQGVNQRLIARQTGMSLGLTNLIIKRMVSKGYIKLKQLTPKKIQYFLTPKGLAEKAKKSYRFTLRTIDTLKLMKQLIQEMFLNEYRRDVRHFIIKGEGELADMAQIAFEGLQLPDAFCGREPGMAGTVKNGNNKKNPNAVKSIILLTDEKSVSTLSADKRESKGNCLDLIHWLSEKMG